MKRKVLVIQGLHPEGLRLLEGRDDVVPVVLMSSDESEIIEAARDVEAITVRTARITRAVIAAAPRLMIVARHGVGYDAVDVPALSARGIPLAIAPQSNMVSVAEHVMFMLLALAKEAAYYDAMTRRADWSQRWNIRGFDLAGKKLLVIGFGRTGSRVARRALAFDMQVLACDPYIDQDLIRAAGCTPVADFRAALPKIDAVSVNTPLTHETRHMFSNAEFAAMPSHSVIVNCARGGIIDEAALHAALVGKQIRAAGLDVFEAEPSPADNPLFKLDNVIVSPHIAGVTVESTIRMSTQTAQNVLDCFDGRLDPEVVVNREVLAREIRPR
jgi:D-3-phosphoglycerate dehydrogenase / 2-oxoglutarate reductase